MNIRIATVPVVLDSCVLFQAMIRDTLLRAAEAGLYRVHWSQQILDDTIRNLLKKNKIKSIEKAEHLIQEMTSAFPDAMVEAPPILVAAMTNDTGDRHVVAAAVNASAQVIVTVNLKHFLKKDLEPWGIEAQTPDIFLTHLYDLAPSLMVNVIQTQAQDCQKPVSVPELLEKLNKLAPQFVSRLQSHFFMAASDF